VKLRARAIGLGLVLLSSCSNNQNGTHSDASTGADAEAGIVDAPPPTDGGPPPADGGPLGEASVLQLHLHATRDGAYVDPKVTRAAAAGLKLDSAFNATYTGQTYAQPLYVQGWSPTEDAVFIVTQTNEVAAFDSKTGKTLWSKLLGPPVPASVEPCHQPPSQTYGILSTPIIDPATRTLFTEAFITPDGGATKHHVVYALSIDNGDLRPGWPVTVDAVVPGFASSIQHDRGALLLLGGMLYIPYSGIAFDCTLTDGSATIDYHGMVVGISITDPTKVTTWKTTAGKGGIWGGLSSDGTSVFFATGNTVAGTTTWGGGEAVIRLSPSLTFSGDTKDYFHPSNWQTLDNDDYDLGSSTATLLDLPGVGSGQFIVAMGKFGTVHLLDRTNLGGAGTGNGVTGEGLYSARVTQAPGGIPWVIQGNPAVYTSTKGTSIVLRSSGPGACGDAGAGDLIALKVSSTSPPTFAFAWCAESQGQGSPMVTTTDGQSNPIVWVVSAQGTNLLLGFDGDTGQTIFNGGGATMTEVLRMTSAIDVNGRFFVGGTNQLYAFDTP
jgi:hypothetical protein